LLSCDPGDGVVSSNLDYAADGDQEPDLRTPEQIVSDVLIFDGHPELAGHGLVTVYARPDLRQITVNTPLGVVAAFTFEALEESGRLFLSRYSLCNGPRTKRR
jgi:hypothetical protein